MTAANGKEAVQAFVSHTVDVVPQIDGSVAAIHMRACKPDVPLALLSGDGSLPPSALEAVDAFISKSEPVTSLLEKVDYLLSLRFLFQSLAGSLADQAGAQP